MLLRLIYDNFLYRKPIQQTALLLARISMGLFFSSTGFNKIFVEQNRLVMLDTITSAGIPFPEFMAVFVSLVELIAGLLLLVGLLTQISAIALFIICFTALITVGIHDIPAGQTMIGWFSWFFYVNDLIYMIILALLITNRPVAGSVDHFLSKKTGQSVK
ncbi:DoxX family protein [Acinetobacter sp. WZC-1]|uniref:DoxX family protein n=1 Tax=Acinetobacter sp. WZC-1 TaxID=3459034 RepID=UPI00403D5BFB